MSLTLDETLAWMRDDPTQLAMLVICAFDSNPDIPVTMLNMAAARRAGNHAQLLDLGKYLADMLTEHEVKHARDAVAMNIARELLAAPTSYTEH